MSESVGPPPEKSTGRVVAETAVEAGLNVIPIVGGVIAVATMAALTHRFNRRADEWLKGVGKALDGLAGRVADLESGALGNDDEFVDVVAQATQAAIRTHHQEKVDALRNAVVNTALRTGAVDADERALFVRWIDEFTPSHLRLLRLLHDPLGYLKALHVEPETFYMGSRMNLVRQGAPDLAERPQLVEQIVRDLASAGLTNTGGLGATITGAGVYQSVSTETGARFLAFISDGEASSA